MDYGINGSISVEAARPIEVTSTTPIAVVGSSANGTEGLFFYGSATLALAHVDADTDTGEHGTLKGALKLIENQGVSCPIVLGVVADVVCDTPEGLTALLGMIDRLKFAEAETGYKPNLIVVPECSSKVEVATAMDVVATRLKATAIVDVLEASESDALAFVSNFSSKHLLFYGPFVHASMGSGMVEMAVSPAIAGMIARTDGEVPFGFADSVSNRVVLGVSSTNRLIDYADGIDCEARRLRNAGIGSIVKDVGWRTYGFETTDIDPIWQSLERVRTFYKALDAIVKASKWARDRRANALVYVRDSIDAFMRELRGNNVALGFEIYFDMQKNTLATVTAGKFYLTVKWQNMSLVRELNIEMVYTDGYGDVLLNYLNGGE